MIPINSSPEQRYPRLREFGRSTAGYTLGFLGINAALSGSILIGPALGAGLLWGSRRVLHKTYDQTETRATETKDKLKRAAVFVGGLAVSSVGAHFMLGGFFNAFERSLTPVGRILVTGLGIATVYAGDKVINHSYSPSSLSSHSPNTQDMASYSTDPRSETQSFSEDDLDSYTPGPEGYMEIYEDLNRELSEISTDQTYTSPRARIDDIADTVDYYRGLARAQFTRTN